MCGLTDLSELSEQDITKQILVKVQYLSPRCLLHGLPTMTEPQYSWCPPRIVDIPSGGHSRSAFLRVNDNGTLSGIWEIWCIPSKIHVDRGVIRPSSTDMHIRTQIQWALHKPEQCVILTCELFDSQGLLVRLKDHKEADKLSRETGHLYCQYIGVVDVTPSEIRQHRRRFVKDVFIGYEPGMVDVGVVDWKRRTRKGRRMAAEISY